MDKKDGTWNTTQFRIRNLILSCLLITGCIISANAVTLNSPSVSIPAIGGTAQVPLSLDSTPDGLSGYNISITVLNPSVIDIISVEFPPWASVNEHSVLPSSALWVKGVDIGSVINSESINIPLGTLTVRGKTAGTTTLSIAVRQMDDDQGAAIHPSITAGTITVTSSGGTSGGSSGGASGISEDVFFTTTVTLTVSPTIVTNTPAVTTTPTLTTTAMAPASVSPAALKISDEGTPAPTQAPLASGLCILGIILVILVLGRRG
jgi:hypothetical protein